MASNTEDKIFSYNADANGDEIQNLYGFKSSTVISRLRRVEKTVPYDRLGTQVFTKSRVQGVSKSAISSTGQVNLSSSAVQKIGAVPPNGITGKFTATADTSSITWYWDGTNGSQLLVVNRADGTQFAVPGGSITITGLAINTTYYFLPFWNTSMGCSVSWVIGTIGSPQIAFVLADTTSTSAQYYLTQQSLQHREQLSGGFMTYATTPAGSSSGDGGGGGKPGNCVMSGTDIDPIGDYGEMSVEILPHDAWTRIIAKGAKGLSGTRDHPVYVCWPEDLEEFKKAMSVLTEESMAPFRCEMKYAEVGQYIATIDGPDLIDTVQPFFRSCTKHSVHLTRGHLFWANGILSHNLKPFNG